MLKGLVAVFVLFLFPLYVFDGYNHLVDTIHKSFQDLLMGLVVMFVLPGADVLMLVFVRDGYNRLVDTIRESLWDLLKGLVVMFVISGADVLMCVCLCDGYSRLLGTIHKSLQNLLKGLVVAFVSVLFLGDRYNRLLGTIHKSLQDLLKALKGLVVMSQELENMANSLYNNTVPSIWASKVGGASTQCPELPATATPTILPLT